MLKKTNLHEKRQLSQDLVLFNIFHLCYGNPKNEIQKWDVFVLERKNEEKWHLIMWPTSSERKPWQAFAVLLRSHEPFGVKNKVHCNSGIFNWTWLKIWKWEWEKLYLELAITLWYTVGKVLAFHFSNLEIQIFGTWISFEMFSCDQILTIKLSPKCSEKFSLIFIWLFGEHGTNLAALLYQSWHFY